MPLLTGWLPAIVVQHLSLAIHFASTLVFLGALIAGAWIFERERPVRGLLFYTALLVAFSPAAANQYLTLAVPFVVVYRNVFTAGFTVVASLHLLIDRNGLHLPWLSHWLPADAVGYSVQVALLLAGVIWALKREAILDWFGALSGRLRERVRHFLEH